MRPVVFVISRIRPWFPLQQVRTDLLLVVVQPGYLMPFYRRGGICERLMRLGWLARYWTLWANHHLAEIRWITAQLAEVDDKETFHDQQSDLKGSLDALGQVARFQDLVQCANCVSGASHVLQRKQPEPESLALAVEFIERLGERVRTDWHQKCCGGCPPCTKGRDAEKEVASAAIRLCRWREINSANMDAISGKRTEILRDMGCVRRALMDLRVSDGAMGTRGIQLSGFSLRRLLLGDIVSPSVLRKLLPDMFAEPAEVQRVGLARARAFLPHAIRCSQSFLSEAAEDSDTIESFMWLLGHYGHDELEIEPRVDIHRHLLHLLRGDLALHSLAPFHRGHSGHVVEVCALGRLLLAMARDDTDQELWQYVVKPTGAQDERDVLRQWYLTALLHDVGHTMKLFNAARGSLEFLDDSKAVKSLCETVDGQLKKLPESFGHFFGFENDRQAGKDHGVGQTA